MELISEHTSFSLNHLPTVHTSRLDLPPADISPQGTVINSLINPGCVIKGLVVNSILSPGVFIDERAEVRNSVLMTSVRVGYGSIVDTCIVDERFNTGELRYAGFGKSSLSGGRDITVLGEGVTVTSHRAKVNYEIANYV